MTASEHLKQLEADPDWVAQRNAREQDQLEREQRSRQEQDALLRDLKSTGIITDSVWDLVNTGKPYPEAFPVLLDHLHRPYHDGIREGIARALAVKDARASMALTQSIGSLLHSDQIRSLREQAASLISGIGKGAHADADDRPAPAQGVASYLPMVLEYAGLFADLLRPKVDRLAQNVTLPRDTAGYWTKARPYVLATVAFGAFGYAAYRLARHQSARRQ